MRFVKNTFVCFQFMSRSFSTALDRCGSRIFSTMVDRTSVPADIVVVEEGESPQLKLLTSSRVNNLRQMMPQLQPGSASASRNHSKRRRVSWENVEHVKNLIEVCLRLHKNKDEAVKTLLTLAKIEPEVTTIVWESLEEENPDFFVTYYIGIELEKRISQFNRLIKNHYPMKCLFPKIGVLAPEQNDIHSMPVNNRPMRSPVLQQPSIPAAAKPHNENIGADTSVCDVVREVPARSNFNPIQANSGNGMVVSHSALNMAPDIPPNGAMSSLLEMPVNPTSVAPEKNGIHPTPVNNLPMSYPVLQKPSIPAGDQPHLESIDADISCCDVVREVPASINFHPIQTNSGDGMVMDHSALDMAPVIASNGSMSPLSEMPVNPPLVPSSGNVPFTAGLQLAPDNGAGISGPLDEYQWELGPSDLPDLTNLPFLGDIAACPGSPFMQSSSDVLFDVDALFCDSEPADSCRPAPYLLGD